MPLLALEAGLRLRRSDAVAGKARVYQGGASDAPLCVVVPKAGVQRDRAVRAVDAGRRTLKALLLPRRRERIFGAHEALRAAAERSVPPCGTLEACCRALRAVRMLPWGTVHAHGVAARDSKTATRAEQALRELTAGGVPSSVALCHVHGCPEDAWGKREEERKRKRERESGRERVREKE